MKISSGRVGRLLWLGLFSSPAAFADISGTVFLDYNLNGQLDSTAKMRNFADTMDIDVAVDRGVAGAQVRAECVTSSGTSTFGPATTDANGQFTLSTAGATAGADNCLLQTVTLPAGYSVGAQSGAGNVQTQFVSPTATGANFAVQETTSYCQNNPDLATDRFAYGQQTLNPPYAGNHDVPNIFAFPYNSGAAGLPNTSPTGSASPSLDANDPVISDLALAQDVGSVFGLGWHPASKSLFAAAYMKAWTGFGPGGTGAIYRINMGDPAHPSTSIYADLNQIFPATPPTSGDNPYLTGSFSAANPGYAQISDGSDGVHPKGTYVASGDATRDNQNGEISNAVSRVGFGDLDVSNDGKSLFTVNMANRKLYILPLRDTPLTAADAGAINSYDIPVPAGCYLPAPHYLVFGLGEYQGSLYVGSSCYTGYGNAAHGVFRFDLATRQFDPNQITGHSSDVDGYGSNIFAITDIVFDAKGNMTLATRAIFERDIAHNVDTQKTPGYGIVYRACLQNAATHTWVRENNGSCGGVTTAGANDGKGFQGSTGRYFYQESTADGNAYGASFGGAAQVPGFLDAAHTVADPFNLYEAGVAWLDVGLGASTATAGRRSRAYGFYHGVGSIDGGNTDDRPVSGKNAALGDLEVLCDAPPIEIGNRVWKDTNANGVQDPGEPPVAGVKVELFAQGADVNTATPLATTVTDAEGYYVFSSDPRGYPTSGNNAVNDTGGATGGFISTDMQGGRASSASHKYGLKSLLPNTQYQVAIRQVAGASKQSALASLSLTASSQGSDAERNSDGSLAGNNAVSSVTTLDAGGNFHAVDFGFIEPSTDLKLGKTVDKTTVRPGDTVVYTLTLENESDVDATNVEVADNLPSNLTFVKATPSAGTFNAGVWSISKVTAKTTETLQIEATAK
ncbi:SdrD B-like domain-containing protein [Candidatus Thiothrix sp. Deng01]|uniref:SdrD B-like domain-containing protein n=1 Tax=Candidatus Thiothrix phosphatis TaxID=3112415 RepID=A0ABU6CX29_9GAMM|nr:SdrD B-like domain-containing protein [Candidatus Thiothrix sp. Deng01]MEB4591335.1 SdrD B-like domain-containing protein [Candidatus Thiothrix sp. Deng01]